MRKTLSTTILVLAGALVVFQFARAQAIKAEKGVRFASPEMTRLDQSLSAQEWNRGFQVVYRTLLNNLHPPAGAFKTRYAYPSPVFRGVYLWDSSFIAQVWKPWDDKTAEDVLRAVLDNAAPNGRLKHFVSPYDKSEYTQPPVIAWSAWEIYQWNRDREFLAYAYPILKKYQLWLSVHRRSQGGLYYWAHSYESGIDNSPRFTSADEKIRKDTTSLAAIDLNSYAYNQNLLLARMAEVLGKPEEARVFQKNAEDLAGLINEKMWDPATGYYYDLDLKTDQLVKIRTIASFLPLFAGAADEQRAKIARDHLMNPKEFNTFFPLPSVARDDPEFEKDCWRGPVWINTAEMAIIGLKNYGFEKDAAELAWKLVDGVYRNYALTGKLVEFYDPDQDGFKDLHRKRGNIYKLLTLGDKPQPNFVGWTGLVNTILIEELIGFHKENGKKYLAPNFPDSAKGAGFQLVLPQENLSLEIEVLEQGNTKGKVISEKGSPNFSLRPGEKLEL